MKLLSLKQINFGAALKCSCNCRHSPENIKNKKGGEYSAGIPIIYPEEDFP